MELPGKSQAFAVPEESLQSLAEGRRPEHMAEDEELLYDFSMELQRNQSVSDATYARALTKFGEEGIADATLIQGEYTHVHDVERAAVR